MPLRSLPFVAAVLALGLGSCRARWRPAGTELEQELSPAGLAARDEVGLEGAEAATRRDFPLPLERVWNATVEAIHTTGVAVPKSASCSGEEGLIDVDALWVHLVSRGPDDTRVLVRYRGLSPEAGAERAEALLDEVGRRARSPHSRGAGER